MGDGEMEILNDYLPPATFLVSGWITTTIVLLSQYSLRKIKILIQILKIKYININYLIN